MAVCKGSVIVWQGDRIYAKMEPIPRDNQYLDAACKILNSNSDSKVSTVQGTCYEMEIKARLGTFDNHIPHVPG